MRHLLLLSAMALALAGCNESSSLPHCYGNVCGGPEPRPPVANNHFIQVGDIVDVKSGVPACPNNLSGQSTLEGYNSQYFRDDERDAAKRFFAEKHSGCFFTKQMMRGTVLFESDYTLRPNVYCVRGHGEADCIWVADGSFVEVTADVPSDRPIITPCKSASKPSWCKP